MDIAVLYPESKAESVRGKQPGNEEKPPMDENPDFLWLSRMAEQRNEDLESVLGYATDGVGKFACDPNLTILYYTVGLAELVGTTRGTIEKEGFNSSLYIHPDDLPFVQQTLQKMLKRNKPFEMRYRLKHISGTYIWVKVKGIVVQELYQNIYPVVYLIYTDITNLVEMNEKLTQAYEQLAFENKRYKAFTEIVNETFFEYDYETNKIVLFGEHVDSPDIAPGTEENIRIFLDAFENKSGVVHLEIPLYNQEHALVWYAIKAQRIHNKEYTWKRIIGTSQNIQHRKDEETRRNEQEKQWKQQASYDSLTQTLNRAALQKAIEEHILVQNGYLGAIVDIDNFKQINDTYGHIVGDEVLKYVAGVLQHACRSCDITGRLGGDEFMIVLSAAMSPLQAGKRLELILHHIQKGCGALSCPLEVSVSMGALLVTRSGLSFLDVYRRADSALYAAKRKGKNTYVLDVCE